MSKPDISAKQLQPWDLYKEKKPDEAAQAIHAHVGETSLMMCSWYWTSIGTKRKASLRIRGVSFVLGLLGTVLPISAALLPDDGNKLLVTQLAVVLIAVAGLLLIADRVFGWSSGWMRYMTTVTTMENLTRAFQLEWGKYLVSRIEPLNSQDAKALFDLASGLEHELTKLQSDETTSWCADFNTGTSLLESLIRTQREEADKKLEAIRTGMASQQKAIETQEKSKLPGAIEVTIKHKGDPKPIRIALDAEESNEFHGITWSRVNVTPGLHVLRVATTANSTVQIEKIIEVAASAVARTEVSLP